MGAFGDFFLGSKGTAGEHGIDTQYIDEYDDYAVYRKQLIDYFGNIMNGVEPEILTKYNEGVEADELNSIERAYYGDPGNRGNSALGTAMQAGAATGLGGAQTAQLAGRVGNEAAAQEVAAKSRSAKFRRDFMSGAQFQATGGLQALDRNPEYYASGYNIQPTAGTEGFLSKAGGAILGAAAGAYTGNVTGAGGKLEGWGMKT